MRDVAISSWALVIFLIDPAERIRPRSSRSVAAMVSYFFFFGAGFLTFHGFLGELILVEGLDMFVGHHRAATGGREALLEVLDDLGELVGGLLGELLAVPDLSQNLFFGGRMWSSNSVSNRRTSSTGTESR